MAGPAPREPADKPPTFLQAFGSALAAAFGVQSSENRQRDFKHGKPIVFNAVGLLVTALFIGGVWLAVKLALKSAGM